MTTCQQILRKVAANWSNFRKALSTYYLNPEGSSPKPPGYHSKRNRGKRLAPVYFHTQDIHASNGYFWFAKELRDLRIEVGRADMSRNRGARLIPTATGYTIELLYEFIEPAPPKQSCRVASIDLGVNNLVALVSNVRSRPLIFRGGKIKSFNHYYNKKLAKLQSQYASQGVHRGQTLAQMSEKRKRKIEDFFHKVSRKVINWCITHKIDTLVVGYIPGWKQNANLGKINNQNFVFIPHHKLLSILRYKSNMTGILFITVDEGYTSKCSFMDMEEIARKSKDQYCGVREGPRFISSLGGTISLGVQSSMQMLMRRPILDGKRLEILYSIRLRSSVTIQSVSEFDLTFYSTSEQSHADGKPHRIPYHRHKNALDSQYLSRYTCLKSRDLVTRSVVSPLGLV